QKLNKMPNFSIFRSYALLFYPFFISLHIVFAFPNNRFHMLSYICLDCLFSLITQRCFSCNSTVNLLQQRLEFIWQPFYALIKRSFMIALSIFQGRYESLKFGIDSFFVY